MSRKWKPWDGASLVEAFREECPAAMLNEEAFKVLRRLGDEVKESNQSEHMKKYGRDSE